MIFKFWTAAPDAPLPKFIQFGQPATFRMIVKGALSKQTFNLVAIIKIMGWLKKGLRQSASH